MTVATGSTPTFGENLNDAQRSAATFGTLEGGAFSADPLLVIAGAGTGKTNTLAHRVAHLLVEGVPAERIALMTFTRRAAQEMLSRADEIAAGALRTRRAGGNIAITRLLWSGTFHSIGNRLLREYAHSIGLDPSFSVIDRGDSGDLIDIVRQQLGLAKKAKRFPRKDTCLSIYSKRVNTGHELEETVEKSFPWCLEWLDELTALFRGYVEAKQTQQLLDYDDLLLYWHALMQDPALAADVGQKFDHVLVDEYQDTNSIQAEILLALKPRGRGLCVVGDDAQSIYSFRAATIANILEFPDQFTPKAHVITLEENYRSVQPILDSANALMRQGSSRFEKNLHSKRHSEQKPRYVMVEDDRAQARFVVERILQGREEGVLLRHQAVLMRKSHDSDVLEMELTRRDIPYVKYGGLKFLEAAHVKDILAILRFIENPKNRLAGFRSLQLLPGIGPANAERCLDLIEQRGLQDSTFGSFKIPAQATEDWQGLITLLKELAAMREWPGQLSRVRTWYEPHLERLHGSAHTRGGDLEQLEALATHHATRESFLTELTLDPPQASGDESGTPYRDEDYLILSTVHSAKGQEWDSVYVLNVVDGTFPNEFATDDPDSIEEERRLLYVAMTRAKRNLHLVEPLRFYVTQQRRNGDKHLFGARSRFMTETVMSTFETLAWPVGASTPHRPDKHRTRIQAGQKMLAMWD